jgi:hypothetical protein
LGTTVNASRRTLIILTLTGIAVAAIISATYVADFARNNGASLPPGCVKPGDGFLVIAGKTGYNDSIAHGAPTKSWPIITVHQGQNVTIVVCNTDVQAHGFQIVHYFVRNEETLVPGQVLKVSFVADQTGTFTIYCDIFCSIHLYMQSGLLNVTA